MVLKCMTEPPLDTSLMTCTACRAECVYSVCQIHASLPGTPAMAADITSDVWSVRELLLCFSVTPQSLHALL
jgi:hypothetical protein